MSKILIIIFCFTLIFYFIFGNKLNPKNKRNLVIVFIVTIGLFLIFTGKLNFLPVAFAPALLFFRKITSILSIFNLFSRSSFGRKFNPSFSTSYLIFKIDLNSKFVDIKVINGSFKGKAFTSMSQTDRELLMSELNKNDIKGYKIIKMILAQSSFSQNQNLDNYELTETNACSILGLKKGASKEDVKKAYYNLMKKFHPDKDGNNYLANLITEAKNRLLNIN